VPDLAVSDSVVHLLEKRRGVMARVEYAVILADEFVFGVFADSTELVIHVSNRALNVGHSHDGVLIEGEFLIGKFFERSLARGQTFF